jgi:hypothetical protein
MAHAWAIRVERHSKADGVQMRAGFGEEHQRVSYCVS